MTAQRILVLVACLAAGCEETPKPVAPVAEAGELVILTVNGPATYFEDAQGLPSGFEFDLASLFAKELGVVPSFVVVDNPTRIEGLLRRGQAHRAAAALARHFDFPGGLAWGPSYFSTQHQVVGRAGESPKPKRLEDIAGKRIGVIEESVADYLLSEPPKFSVPIERLPPGSSTADVLELVAAGKLDYALVESTRFTLARRFFPQVEVAFNVGKPIDYAWLVSTADKKSIMDATKPFFERIKKDGTLKRLVDRYYGHAMRFSAVDSGAVLEQITKQLPKLKPHFQEAERLSGVDWRLLAAIGYQESHWDSTAVSPTGVRGIMQLTAQTATFLRVSNRDDPAQSIMGGARYIRQLIDLVPPEVPEPDRSWLALAAYNMGWGHLLDARDLTRRLGGDPDRWLDVRNSLPLLTQSKWHALTKYGYARGHEAVTYVGNIRTYYDMLSWITGGKMQTAEKEAPAAPAAPKKPGEPLNINSPVL